VAHFQSEVEGVGFLSTDLLERCLLFGVDASRVANLALVPEVMEMRVNVWAIVEERRTSEFTIRFLSA
jgi:hypothetical protein